MEFMNEAYRIVGIGTLEFLEGNFNSKNLEMDPGHQFGLDEVISFFKILSSDKRILFFKGLVLCEKHFNWQNGSVPTTKECLDYILHNDFHSDEVIKNLYDWAFENRGENPYTPTGFIKHGKHTCNSYEDMIRRNGLTKYNTHPDQETIRIRRQRRSHIRQLKHLLRNLEREETREQIKEKIDRFLFLSENEIVESIKNNNLDFPITLLPEKTIDLFIKRVSFENEFKKKIFLNSLPKKTNRELTKKIKSQLSY